MSLEEKEDEEEYRGMNQRRMIWLENDLELMNRLINADITETVRQHLDGNADRLL